MESVQPPTECEKLPERFALREIVLDVGDMFLTLAAHLWEHGVTRVDDSALHEDFAVTQGGGHSPSR